MREPYQGTSVFLLILVTGLIGPVGAGNWGQWRGPNFNGTAEETGLPGQWEVGSQKAGCWSVPLPGESGATPAVWGDRIFLTSVDDGGKQVVAMGVSAVDGKILWRATLAPNRKTAGANTMASPSPVTDGKSVWFLTGNAVVAAFSVEGKPLWRRELEKDYGQFQVYFGYSSSPLLFEGKLYILALQNDVPDSYGVNRERTEPLDSYLLALDPATGKTLWKQNRATDATSQSRESYATPIPYKNKDHWELLIAGGECVTGHDPASGRELWRWWYPPRDREKLQHVVPSPVGDGERIIVVRPEHRPLYSIRPGCPGENEEDFVQWSWAENPCWICTPLLYRGRLYVPDEEKKLLYCLDPATGRVVWQQELPVKGKLQASPTGADGKVYLMTMNGEVVVLEAGDRYKLLGQMDYDDAPSRGAVVAANGRLYLRTGKQLHCVAGTGSGGANQPGPEAR